MAEQMPEIKLDADNMYREESYSDLKVGQIRRLVPVTANGDDDNSRSVRYEGQANLMTPAGSLPLTFELRVDNLADAIAQFPAAVNVAAEQTINELKELQRQQSQKIQMPGQGGGASGGGRIQF